MQSTSRSLLRLAIAAVLLLQAGAASAAILTVTSAADSGAGTLRDTVAASASGDTIRFAPPLSGQTIRLASTIVFFRSLTIDGSTLATPITISGDTNSDSSADVQIFGAIAGTVLTVDSVTLTLGHTAGYGGAIQSAGTVNLIDTTVSDCDAAVAGGVSASTLVVRGSTFANNTASNSAGALQAIDGTVVNTTITGNSASQGGAIRINDGDTMRLFHCTISGNYGVTGAGLYVNGTLVLENSIVANSSVGADCLVAGGGFASNVQNLIEDGTCDPALSGDPALGSLQDNGGPTQTLLPAASSPAVDTGSEGTCTGATVGGVDQRGADRPEGFDCDIGATESGSVFVVNDTGDGADGACDANCTLRDAVAAANARPGPDAIHFASAMTITLTSQLPVVTGPLLVDGQGQAVTIQSNGGLASAMFYSDSTELRLFGLTLRDGNSLEGGAVLAIYGKLAVRECSFENNFSSGNGGAISALQTDLAIDRSALLSNSAAGYGGAIFMFGGGADINNVTFGDNQASDAALSIDSTSFAGVVNSTFSGNTASISHQGSALGLGNVLMGNSTGAPECSSQNLFFSISTWSEDGSCFGFPGDPGIETVAAANGGPTKTFKLLETSQAIDLGDASICEAAGNVDQRGTLRPIGAACDIGAYEYGVAACGNGLLEGGEDCDDGNVADGDCCSSTCTAIPDGTLCTSDSIGCTVQACHIGACVTTPDNSVCDDGSLCTSDWCDTGTGCVNAAEPIGGCEHATPGTASLRIVGGADPAKRSVQFKWGKGSFDYADLGSPASTTDYSLCVYQAGYLISSFDPKPAGAMCGKKPCWSTTGTGPTGIKYKDGSRTTASDGISSVAAKSSDLGKGVFQWKAKGQNLPAFLLGSGSGVGYPVRVQVLTSDASCWEARFESEDVSENTGESLKARF